MQALPINSQAIDPVNFFFESHEIRVFVDQDGQLWFVCRDVFNALDVTWSGTKTSLKNYPKKWVMVLQCKTNNGVRDVLCMSEAGVYKTIFASRKPQAETFTNFVCDEVLPLLRKQGFFGVINGANRLSFSKELRGALAALPKADAFGRQLLIQDIRALCGMLGYPVPSLDLIGADPAQLALPMPGGE